MASGCGLSDGVGKPPADRLPATRSTALWAIWLALLVLALVFVARYSRNVPWGDEEWKLMPILSGEAPPTLGSLWEQSGEHRNALARLLLIVLIRTTGDFRASMFLHALILAALAAILIRASVRIRGEPAFSDALFPLALLNWGQLVNRLSGVRLQFALASFFFLAAVLCMLALETGWRRRTALCLCGSVLALPLCGANGLLLSPLLAGWLVYLGARRWRSGEWRTDRTGFAALLVAGAGVLAILGVYLASLEPVRGWMPPTGLGPSARLSARFASMSLGMAARFLWPLSGFFAIGIYGLTVARLLSEARAAERGGSRSAVALLVALAAFGVLLVAMGYGRSGHGEEVGHNPRYGPQAVALVCLCYVAWLRCTSGARSKLATGALAAVVCACSIYNFAAGRDELAAGQAADREEFQKDAWEGVSSRDLATAHIEKIHLSENDVDLLTRLIETARRARIPPFDVGPRDRPRRLRPIYRSRYTMLPTRPSLVRSAHRVVPLIAYGVSALLVHAPGAMTYPIGRGRHRLAGRFGLAEDTFRQRLGDADGVTFRVSCVEPGGARAVLLERTVPHTPAGRGLHALDVAVPDGRSHRALILDTDPGPSGNSSFDWSIWTDVRVQRTH